MKRAEREMKDALEAAAAAACVSVSEVTSR